jgi:hypothetical protein
LDKNDADAGILVGAQAPVPLLLMEPAGLRNTFFSRPDQK